MIYSASLKSNIGSFVLPFHIYLFNSKREVLSFFKRGEGSWSSWVSAYLTYFPSMLHSLKSSLDSNPWLLSTPTPAISKTQLNGSCQWVRDDFLEALLSLGWLSVNRTRGRPCPAELAGSVTCLGATLFLLGRASALSPVGTSGGKENAPFAVSYRLDLIVYRSSFAFK